MELFAPPLALMIDFMPAQSFRRPLFRDVAAEEERLEPDAETTCVLRKGSSLLPLRSAEGIVFRFFLFRMLVNNAAQRFYG